MWRSLQAPLAREPALVPTPLLGTLGKMMPKQKEEARVKELAFVASLSQVTTWSLPCSSLRTLLPFKQNVAFGALHCVIDKPNPFPGARDWTW